MQTSTIRDKPLAIDLFCGAGGLSLGLERAGFQLVCALDNDEDAIISYNHNNGNHGHIKDIENIDKQYLKRKFKIDTENISLIAGGPPCQGFSVQRRGDDKDKRNNLVLEFIKLVLEIRPNYFLMENVSGLLSNRGAAVMEKLQIDCVNAGYNLKIGKLNAANFGVPQNRVRTFLVGHLNWSIGYNYNFPAPFDHFIQSPKTVRDSIVDIQELSDLPNHRADKLSALNLKRIQSITQGQGRGSLPDELQLDCHKNNKSHRHLDTYGRMAWDYPAPTITARFDSFSRGRFGHPIKDRSITLREGARLQSFPDSFVFFGTKVSVAKQIGNAVPPILAEVMGESIMQHLIIKKEEVA